MIFTIHGSLKCHSLTKSPSLEGRGKGRVKSFVALFTIHCPPLEGATGEESGMLILQTSNASKLLSSPFTCF